ncbi:PfkB family carbohydrate kinase [Catenuloplanes atrovinosus]|uniref:PfkB family carbohydrate kinase n=1 Tax=Catenuloplanes atrovinosus TaxID=137266 RepID=UPI00286A9836|nr:PfkB family carbohydrate kinase [Catenuloplanes atrovinosus]
MVVTAGRHGAWAQSAAGQRWRATALAVDVRQPQGAGAAFSAGLIHTWDTGQDIAARLRFACAVGSLWCTRATSDPLPTDTEVAEALTP